MPEHAEIDVSPNGRFAMDPDGGNIKLMVPVPKDREPVQIADRVVSFRPEYPDNILMAFNPDDPSLPRVYRVNVNTARKARVEGGEKDVLWWTADQLGNLWMGNGFNNTELLETRYFRSPPAWNVEGHQARLPLQYRRNPHPPRRTNRNQPPP